MKPLTLEEAAEFLRMSRSNLYQRKDIPRYRRPGSRVLLFDQEELEAWLKAGRIDQTQKHEPKEKEQADQKLDFNSATVYHRNPLYQ